MDQLRQEEEEEHATTLIFDSSSSSSSRDREDDVEHLFDKVVTPSDVGKLNRLVIPKQFAEKYFPLKPSALAASASAAKGVQLAFEDRGAAAGRRLWEFRYSYWRSSQSYVMTRGWSRFVREKRLRTGDTVSFCRSPRGGRLFIDCCRRRLPHPRPGSVAAALRSPTNTVGGGGGGGGGGGVLSFHWGPGEPIVVDLQVRRVVVDVPAAPPKAKRLRLFGVDVECVVAAGEPATT